MTSFFSLSRIGLVFVTVGMGLPAISMAQVTLLYNERPPYTIVKDGQLTGLTGTPTIAAFKAAGIPFTIQANPSARQLATIKENSGADCGVGWFKNEERLGFGKFTKAIYQDKPQIALTAASNAKLKNGETIESVLGNKDTSLLVKQSYSYGKAVDALIAKYQPKQQSVTVESTQMLMMIQAGRADYMIIAPEEADGLIAASGISAADIRKVNFSNAPSGEERYLLCSKKVSDEIIGKLNAAIK